jgi:hypothetical protein
MISYLITYTISLFRYRYRNTISLYNVTLLPLISKNKYYDIEVTTLISKLQPQYPSFSLDIISKVTSMLRSDDACSPRNVSNSRWHDLFPWPKHVEKFATLSLVSNNTTFFNTPAHHASVSNVIKVFLKITPLNKTPSAVKDGVLGGGHHHEFLGMVRAAAEARADHAHWVVLGGVSGARK